MAETAGAESGALRVEVCLAVPGRSVRIPLALPHGSTVADAVEAALAGPLGGALREALGAGDPAGLGVFGRAVLPQRLLADGDRVELYRPLAADPKLARQQRVERQRATGGRSRWRPGAA